MRSEELEIKRLKSAKSTFLRERQEKERMVGAGNELLMVEVMSEWSETP